MADFKTFDPKLVVMSFAGIQISGYMDGTFIMAEREVDTFEKSVGAGGDVTRVRSNNRSGTITLTLQAASPTNDLLSARAIIDEQTGLGTGVAMVKNINGTTLVSAADAWIQKPANVEYADTASGREWVIACADMRMFIGGALI